MRMIRSVSTCLALLVGVAAGARADVVAVPAGIGNLQAAIDAAADGDVLLLAGGFHGIDVVIDGKALTLATDDVVQAAMAQLTVRNLPAGSRVLLRGLLVTGTSLGAQAGLTVEQCADSVWIEGCTLRGDDGAFSGDQGGAGLEVREAHAVMVSRSTLAGGPGGAEHCTHFGCTPAGLGGPGLAVHDGLAALHDCDVTAGQGGDTEGTDDPVAGGGAGVRVSGDGFVLLSGSRTTGGAGGDSLVSTPEGIGGGDALVVEDPGGHVWRLDSELVPGAGCFGTPDGVAVVAPGGALIHFPGEARDIAVPSPLREGESSTLTVTGAPGDLAGYFWGFTPDTVPLLDNKGVFALGAPFQGVFVLGVNATGTWELPFTVPDLPLGFEHLTFLVQVVAQDPTDLGIRVGGVTALTLLDDTL